MSLSVPGFAFAPPSGFVVDESTLALKAPLAGTGPSLVVNSRPVRPTATLEGLATELSVELAQTLGALSAPSQTELQFDDGAKGLVVSHTVTTQKGSLRQYFVLRLEKLRLCTMTLTVPEANLSEGTAPLFMKVLTSLRSQA